MAQILDKWNPRFFEIALETLGAVGSKIHGLHNLVSLLLPICGHKYFLDTDVFREQKYRVLWMYKAARKRAKKLLDGEFAGWQHIRI